MKGASDSTLLLRTKHTRRLRVLVGLLLFALCVSGCRGPSRATLQDAGKSVAELRAMLADPNPEVQARGALMLSQHGTEA
ncbi:MAG: hypothetical protein L0241_06860, partial [Planctomycetia bacterium]|nr:hypothetical protein [Planctomycetia bacterium]